MMLTEPAQLAWDTILQKPTRGIPTFMLHVMAHSHLERLAGAPEGTYRQNPDETYLAAQRAIGTCVLDQYLARNPLTMTSHGFDQALGIRPPQVGGLDYTPVDIKSARVEQSAAGRTLILNEMAIGSPEAVVEHLERFVFPRIEKDIAEFDADRRVKEIIARETGLQARIGPDFLKSGYGFIYFPYLYYSIYGYDLYFMAYALYPEVMEKHFRLQADYAELNNRAAERAYREANLPPLFRLDHDMAGSRGTLCSMKSLERLWFPHFRRSLEPLLNSDVRLIWHCDGNLMEMAPRLLDVGIRGFQGFQYEDGMDYARICALKAKDGGDLLIVAGVSVMTTLPFGAPVDVKAELAWLVEHGPETGLFLTASSTITPETSWENLHTLIEGIRHYREHGRAKML